MASYAYVSQILLYDNDSGNQSLRHQKLRINPDTNQTYVPLVSSLTAREYDTSSKFDSTDTHGRHLNLDLVELEEQTMIPYGSADVANLKGCIRQLLDQPGVNTGRYVGEYQLNGDTANHNL